jgi:hypothetical protein
VAQFIPRLKRWIGFSCAAFYKNTVREHLRAMGVTLRPLGGPNNAKDRVLLTLNGKTLPLRKWAHEPEQQALGITRSNLYMRVCAYGWPPEKALTTPVQAYKREN